MQEHAILKYMRERHLAEFGEEEAKRPGPVLTISRDYGCPGYSIGVRMAELLSKHTLADGSTGEWKAVNREILTEAAGAFDLPEAVVEKMYRKAHPANPLADLFRNLPGNTLPSDVKIKKRIADIVLKLAMDGRYVIVGQGGAVLARNIFDSVHVRLYAPLTWRVEHVMQSEGLSKEAARQRIALVDNERVYLRKFLSGELPTEDFFDVSFNTATVKSAQIESAILDLMFTKHILRER